MAMYAQGTGGFGHLRRNASIAQALRRSALKPTIVMIAEAWQANALPMPRGVDYVTLPAIRRAEDGSFSSRILELSDPDITALRSAVIQSVMKGFDADLLLVDQWPLGAAGELIRPLRRARKRGHVRCVLGLRDVLFSPETVRRTWATPDNLEAIRDYYDAVWIYGDQAVYDAVRKYDLPEDVAAKVRYVGYLDQRPRLAHARDKGRSLVDSLPTGRLALCVVSSGRSGAALAEAFSQAELPPGTTGVVVTGFVDESAPLMERADRVIANGGYNTICEVLSFGKHALIVPRVRPDSEQWIRATGLADLGLLEMLHPDRVTPQALSGWLARDLGPPPDIRRKVDIGALAHIPGLVTELLNSTAGAKRPHLARRALGGLPA